jgi:hypothetical protein
VGADDGDLLVVFVMVMVVLVGWGEGWLCGERLAFIPWISNVVK